LSLTSGVPCRPWAHKALASSRYCCCRTCSLAGDNCTGAGVAAPGVPRSIFWKDWTACAQPWPKICWNCWALWSQI